MPYPSPNVIKKQTINWGGKKCLGVARQKFLGVGWQKMLGIGVQKSGEENNTMKEKISQLSVLILFNSDTGWSAVPTP